MCINIIYIYIIFIYNIEHVIYHKVLIIRCVVVYKCTYGSRTLVVCL